MLNFIRNHKVIGVVILVNVIAVICLVVAIVIYNKKTATVDIRVAPYDAQILINGQSYDNFSSANLLPGEYTAEISKDGMQTRKIDFTLKNDEFYRLHTYLLDEDGGFGYYVEHSEDRQMLAEIPEDPALQVFLQHQNLADMLPYNYEYFSDDYSKHIWFTIEQSDKECEYFCLVIKDYTGGNFEMAKQKLFELGFNIESCEIEYQYNVADNPVNTGYGSK